VSRVLFVTLDEGQVAAKCLAEKVGISAIERLPAGGIRLVCMSSDGAERMRGKFRGKLMKTEATRELHRPRTPIW